MRDLENILNILDKVDQAEVANKEIIVVDDMSTDGTRDILEEKVKPRVSKIVYHEVNGGKGAALKTGFAAALSDVSVTERRMSSAAEFYFSANGSTL